jgi:tryptophanyl-tRNA synthetase
MTIYSVLSGKTTEELEKEYEGKMYGHLKVDLADVVVQTLRPVREKYDDLMQNKDHLDQLMKSGSERARARSKVTLENVYKAVGLVR